MRVRDLGLGVAELRAVLPVEGAAACLSALRDRVAALPADDPRNVGQQLADALVDAVTGSAGKGAAPLVQVLVPIEVLGGQSEAPAVLVGHGPVGADTARRVAAMRGAVLQRVLVDAAGVPVAVDGRTAAPGRRRGAGPPPARGARREPPPDPTGCDPTRWSAAGLAAQLDAWQRSARDASASLTKGLRSDGYRPPARLAALVAARDVTCRFPGCRRAGGRGDLDHVGPRAAGGRTAADNLVVLCRSHHRLKHTPGWSTSRSADGSVTWTAPDGRSAVVALDPLPVRGLYGAAAPRAASALPAGDGEHAIAGERAEEELDSVVARMAAAASRAAWAREAGARATGRAGQGVLPRRVSQGGQGVHWPGLAERGAGAVGATAPEAYGPWWPEPIGDLPRALWNRAEHDLVEWLTEPEARPTAERPLVLVGDEDWPPHVLPLEPEEELADSPLVAALLQVA